MTDTPPPVPVDPRLLEILVCPLTKGPLVYDRAAGELISNGAAPGISDPRRHPDHAGRRSAPAGRAARPGPGPGPGPGNGRASGAMTAGDAPPVPREIRLDRAERRLEVDFGPLGRFTFPAEFLRVNSPSAEVQGHGPGQRRLVAGRRLVGIAGVEPVGHYAVRLRFDDGHDTGIYTWNGLLEMGRDQDALWRDYLSRLAAAGLSRDP